MSNPFRGPSNRVWLRPAPRASPTAPWFSRLWRTALANSPTSSSPTTRWSCSRASKKLGFALRIDRNGKRVSIDGRGGDVPATSAKLFCGNSGTTIRFLTALCALGRGTFTLDGIERMRQRPIGELVQLLAGLGARIKFDAAEGFPPITLSSDRLPGGLSRFGGAQIGAVSLRRLAGRPLCTP